MGTSTNPRLGWVPHGSPGLGSAITRYLPGLPGDMLGHRVTLAKGALQGIYGVCKMSILHQTPVPLSQKGSYCV
jgi:hypothetical protein